MTTATSCLGKLIVWTAVPRCSWWRETYVKIVAYYQQDVEMWMDACGASRFSPVSHISLLNSSRSSFGQSWILVYSVRRIADSFMCVIVPVICFCYCLYALPAQSIFWGGSFFNAGLRFRYRLIVEREELICGCLQGTCRPEGRAHACFIEFHSNIGQAELTYA